MTKQRAARGGFTLVELLVVIGIIAILISVLLPVLGSARRSAASVKCLSNLKNLHNAFLMYAGDFKNSMPVARQDCPDDGRNPPPANAGPQNQQNLYWQDGIYPYLLRRAIPTHQFTAKEFIEYRKSVLWCPVWESEHPEIDLNAAYGERFKTGYGYNPYFAFRPDYPKPDAMLPDKQLAFRWAGTIVGKYFKRNEISDQANRLLVADGNVWFIGLKLTDTNGTILGQQVYASGSLSSEHSTAAGGPGAVNLDRYRHGKYSSVAGGTPARHNVKGGQVKYNALFVDGHASTLLSIDEGYKAIRMRFP
jgi:prepilin-type N-terminal cleavage/methylation domain-containing protein/prepilin-type processing-associated H-X9-DG protein